MSLLREWAHRAQKEGLDGAMIRQILNDKNFEETAASLIAPPRLPLLLRLHRELAISRGPAPCKGTGPLQGDWRRT